MQIKYKFYQNKSLIVLCCEHFSIFGYICSHIFTLSISPRSFRSIQSISFAYSCFIPEFLIYCHWKYYNYFCTLHNPELTHKIKETPNRRLLKKFNFKSLSLNLGKGKTEKVSRFKLKQMKFKLSSVQHEVEIEPFIFFNHGTAVMFHATSHRIFFCKCFNISTPF